MQWSNFATIRSSPGSKEEKHEKVPGEAFQAESKNTCSKYLELGLKLVYLRNNKKSSMSGAE